VIYGVIDLQLRTLRLIDSTRARPRTPLDVATLFLDNDVMLTALPYSSMSIFRSAIEVPETSDYLIRKLGAGVLANLPREDSSYMGCRRCTGRPCSSLPNAQANQIVTRLPIGSSGSALQDEPAVYSADDLVSTWC
jgi:hypothetical protein